MTYEQFVKMIREAGSKMTHEQISKIGEEAKTKFGIDKDALMLLLISGTEEFKNWIFNQASNLYDKQVSNKEG